MAAKSSIEPRGISLGSTALGSVDEIEAFDVARGFKATVNGLVVSGNPKIEAWAEAGRFLRTVERGAQFALGDCVNFGEARYGDEIWQHLDASHGWSEKTVGVYSWLAKAIDPAIRRMDRLGIKHHILVAKLPHDEQAHWLTRAAADQDDRPWTTGKLRREMRAAAGAHDGYEFFVEVECKSEDEQVEVREQLAALGLRVKTVTRKRREEVVAATPGDEGREDDDQGGDAGLVAESAPA